MADENQGPQGAQDAAEQDASAQGAPATAPEGWDEAFGADAPKPHTPPASDGQQAWQAPVPEPVPVAPAYAKSCLAAGWEDCKQLGFWKKTAFLGLLDLVPVLNFVNTGYALEWSKEVPFGGRTALPQKVVTGRNFEIGFYAFVITLVFSLIGGCAGGIVGWIPLIGWIAALAIGFLISMFTCVLNLRMAMRSQLGEGFKVGDAWTVIKRDWAGLMCAVVVPGLIAGAIIVVASFVYMFFALLFFLPVMGAAVNPDPAFILGALLGGGLGFLVVTAVFCYLGAWAGAAAQLVSVRAAAHWVARFAGDWTYLA